MSKKKKTQEETLEELELTEQIEIPEDDDFIEPLIEEEQELFAEEWVEIETSTPSYQLPVISITKTGFILDGGQRFGGIFIPGIPSNLKVGDLFEYKEK